MHARLAAALLLYSATAPTVAQEAQRIEVHLSSFAFTPSTITLQHGQRYVLAIHNDAKGSHNFEARRFFDDAVADSADQARIDNGRIELKGGAGADIHLTAPARPGTYKLTCTHFLHASFGMTGTITVR